MKRNKNENFLERVPKRSEKLTWKTDENGLVTLEIENKGVFNKLFQLILKKPKVSYIHLDENGSFVWKNIDGEKSITDIGILVDEKFGEEAQPLYERLSQFFGILESYGFVTYKK